MPEHAAETLPNLFDPGHLRSQSWKALARAERGDSEHFAISHTALQATVHRLSMNLAPTIERQAPPLDNCWFRMQENFADDLDLLAKLLANSNDEERAKSGLDLAFLTAIADPGGRDDTRFLAVLQNFVAGEYMGDERGAPSLDVAGIQARLDDGEDLPSWERTALTESLRILGSNEALFGALGRFGDILGPIKASSSDKKVEALTAFQLIGPVLQTQWPGPTRQGRRNAGDAWRAEGLFGPASMVSFQAPVLRLITAMAEPLDEAGFRLRGLKDLPAAPTLTLAKALIDLDILAPKHSAVVRLDHPPGSDIVVECRCLVVALCDRLTDHLTKELKCTTAHLPAQRVVLPLGEAAAKAERPTDFRIATSLF